MGWWKRLLQRIDDWDMGVHDRASWKLGQIRSSIRYKYGTDPEVVHPLEAEKLRCQIRSWAASGYASERRTAQVLWEIGMTMYPNHISVKDRPSHLDYPSL